VCCWVLRCPGVDLLATVYVDSMAGVSSGAYLCFERDWRRICVVVLVLHTDAFQLVGQVGYVCHGGCAGSNE
jgi:hypothetical protein